MIFGQPVLILCTKVCMRNSRLPNNPKDAANGQVLQVADPVEWLKLKKILFERIAGGSKNE